MLVLGNRIGHYDLINGGCVYTRNRVAAENTMSNKGIDLCRTLSFEQLSGAGDGVAGVDKIVNEDADAVGDITDKHHAGIALLGELNRSTFLICVSLVRGSKAHSITL